MATDLDARHDDATSRGLSLTRSGHPPTGAGVSGPHTLDRYVLLDELGAGGMGVVHRAYDPKLHREVAIKMLRFDRRGGSETHRAETRILREAQAMAKLSHPHVLPVYDVERVGELVYIVMEYVDGETLGRWMRRDRRPWAELVDVFLAAGRGLEAAHRAGIIHRDFKPSNVLLGNRGRVLVTDFGLARAHDAPHDDLARRPRLPGWAGSPPRAQDSLTLAGEVVGTPPYMAPEQMRGEVVDARADQYSYCVALFEGLFGQRPFLDHDPRQLLAAKEARHLEPDRAVSAPAWLLRIIERGLCPEPGQRFASMTELLQQLGRDPHRWRRRAQWGAGGAMLGGALIGLRVAATSGPAPCPPRDAVVDELWGDRRAPQVRAALLATGQSYAADTADRVIERLDAYAHAWAGGHVDACAATRVRHEQSAEAFDLRMACLGRQRIELEATIEALSERVSRRTLRRAPLMVEALPDPAECADAEALRTRARRRTSPATAAELERHRQSLARAQVLLRAGQSAESDQLASSVEARGLTQTEPALRSEARLVRGRLLEEARELDEAERTLRAGFADAVEGRDAVMAVELALRLGHVLGVLQARTAEAEQWVEQARAWLRGSDPADPRFARLWLLEGGIYQVAGRLDEARASFSRAVELMRRRPATVDLAEAHRTLGLALMALGQTAEATRQFEAELEINEDRLGPHHPEVARALQSLGATAYVSGRLPTALPLFERSLSILEAALGPDHPRLVAGLDNLASLRDDLGEHEEARELYERALHILASSDDTRSNAIVRLRGNLAQALRHAGEYDAAAAHLRDAIAALESEHGPGHPDRIDLLARLGVILLEAGRPEPAREVLERADELRAELPAQSALVSADVALALARVRIEQRQLDDARSLLTEAIDLYRSLGPALDPRRGHALLELGTVALTRGRPDDARERLEAAIPLLTTPRSPARLLARARFTLARALARAPVAPSDEARARRLARDARAGLDDDDAQREIDAWLDVLERSRSAGSSPPRSGRIK